MAGMSTATVEAGARPRERGRSANAIATALRLRSKANGWAMVAILGCVILLFPLYWMVGSSLEPMSALLTPHLSIFPGLSQLDGSVYTSTFHQYQMARWILNSALVTVGTVCLTLLVSVPAGYSLSRLRSGPASTTAGIGFLISRAVPGTFLAIPFFVMAERAHVLNTLWAVMLADSAVTVPFTAWLLRGFFDAVPFELEEAAALDGCGMTSALLRVVIPIARPGIGAAGIYAAIGAWSDLLFSATLLMSPSHWTVTVGAVSMVTEQSVNWNGLMAAGVISCVPLLAVFVLLEPYLVSGLSAGAVVG